MNTAKDILLKQISWVLLSIVAVLFLLGTVDLKDFIPTDHSHRSGVPSSEISAPVSHVDWGSSGQIQIRGSW